MKPNQVNDLHVNELIIAGLTHSQSEKVERDMPPTYRLLLQHHFIGIIILQSFLHLPPVMCPVKYSG